MPLGSSFLELGLGSETERGFCSDMVNRLGLHGNALLARAPLTRPFMLRLPGERHWFMAGGDQPRLGERMAIGAVIETTGGPMVAVSTHLESVAHPPAREAQMAAVLDALDQHFPGAAGGDRRRSEHRQFPRRGLAGRDALCPCRGAGALPCMAALRTP